MPLSKKCLARVQLGYLSLELFMEHRQLLLRLRKIWAVNSLQPKQVFKSCKIKKREEQHKPFTAG